jgi:hypothetical protein
MSMVCLPHLSCDASHLRLRSVFPNRRSTSGPRTSICVNSPGPRVEVDLRRKFLGRGVYLDQFSQGYLICTRAGYKVGRVDQAETALGAEMRVKADKSKGKVSADKTKEKIVRRSVPKFDFCGH